MEKCLEGNHLKGNSVYSWWGGLHQARYFCLNPDPNSTSILYFMAEPNLNPTQADAVFVYFSRQGPCAFRVLDFEEGQHVKTSGSCRVLLTL